MDKKRTRSRAGRKKSGAAPRGRPRAPVGEDQGSGSAAKAIGPRLRLLRLQQNLSQGDIESRTGLLRCYISRVEGGHTIPNLLTLEKFAAALQVPLHLIFFHGKGTPVLPAGLAREAQKTTHLDDALARKLRRLVGKMDDRGRQTLFGMVRKLAVMKE